MLHDDSDCNGEKSRQECLRYQQNIRTAKLRNMELRAELSSLGISKNNDEYKKTLKAIQKQNEEFNKQII